MLMKENNIHRKMSRKYSLKVIVVIALIFSTVSLVIRELFRFISIFRKRSSSIFDRGVVYLYPQKNIEASIMINYKGRIVSTLPTLGTFQKGWEVSINPSGEIKNKLDGKKYKYLFWEGIPKNGEKYDFSKGFIVKGEDTNSFLRSKLSEIGLIEKESEEFIAYWQTKMNGNKFNLIHFSVGKMAHCADLNINPGPDSNLRVFMVFRPLNNNKKKVEQQKFEKFERFGFTVVEWGGSEVSKI